jgi:hypothetical protein
VQRGIAAGDRVVMDSASLPQGTHVNVKPYTEGNDTTPVTSGPGRQG